jgi:DNA/RNA endonuclease YhcR with UshA esterase domain
MKLRKRKDAPEGTIVASVNGREYEFAGTKAVEIKDAADFRDLQMVGYFEDPNADATETPGGTD